MSERFTKKQMALLAACAKHYPEGGDGVMVKSILGDNEHSMTTASSLARRGWVTIWENYFGEAWAYFDSQQYSEWTHLGAIDE